MYYYLANSQLLGMSWFSVFVLIKNGFIIIKNTLIDNGADK